MFKITITEIPNPLPPRQLEIAEAPEFVLTQPVERYQQTVDSLDLSAVMAAVNRKPRKRRTAKTA
jgi:hypothetical protein